MTSRNWQRHVCFWIFSSKCHLDKIILGNWKDKSLQLSYIVSLCYFATTLFIKGRPNLQGTRTSQNYLQHLKSVCFCDYRTKQIILLDVLIHQCVTGYINWRAFKDNEFPESCLDESQLSCNCPRNSSQGYFDWKP